MKVDITKYYYFGFVYNNGPYSVPVIQGNEIVIKEGITDKYSLQVVAPPEPTKNTKSLAGMAAITVSIPADKVNEVVQGGVDALSDPEHFGSLVELSFNRKGVLMYLRWGK